MRVTFRLKVVLLLLTALLSLTLMMVGSEFVARELRAELTHVEARLVPRAELALKLEASFVELTRSLQDAVSAQDIEALEASKDKRSKVIGLVNNAGTALESRDAAALRGAIGDYFKIAHGVSAMLIKGDAGEGTLPAIAEMQEKQKTVERLIRESTSMGRNEISQAFSSLQRASLRSSYFRIATGVAALLLLVCIWFWASRQLLQSLSALSAGFSKFATGNFERPIDIRSHDELGDLTRDANAMAHSLKGLAEERDRADWIKSGQVELSLTLRGNLSLHETAERTLRCLIGRTGALAAVLYAKGDTETFDLLACHADGRGLDETPSHSSISRSFAPGQGLVGQAAIEGKLQVISDLPQGYFEILSGLGKSTPRTLVLFPLRSGVETFAVVELALLADFSSEAKDYLNSIEDTLVASLVAAHGRENVNRLLGETRAQAEQLAQQEEELRLSNQELSAQQEELRLANVELKENQDALAARNAALNRARTREREKAEELGRVSLYKSQFLANMSHELRTPLNSMLLLSHLLSENSSGNLTPKQVEHSSTIHSAGQELLELINQVLDLAKIEAGKQEVDVSTVRLGPLLDQLRRMFEPLATNKGLSLDVELHPQAPKEIHTDRPRLERILINLLGNAIKFTEQGRVALAVGPVPPTATFERNDLAVERTIAFVVSDTGIGIAAGELSRVFSPFEQVEATSSRRYEGSGLGLTIARESASLLGGELRVASELGKGSTFTCYLPLGTSADDSLSQSQIHAPLPKSTPSESNDFADSILVVEDDPLLAEQLVEIIEDRGFGAVVARTGEDGLRLAREHQPRGIVLDVKLPDIDGFTVMERLQTSPPTSKIPVHFLSAVDAPQTGLSRGAVGYLTKPASREQLKALIETLAPTRQNKNSKILVVEDSVVEGESIVALLEHESFDAKHVTSAEAALTALEQETFSCVVLDLGLQEMDGLKLLEVLQGKPHLVGIGVVIHTGRSLTRKETNRLQAYTQAIVMKDGSSSARLLEEIRLFVHHVRGSTPSAGDVTASALEAFTGTRVLVVEDDMRTVYSLSALLQSRGCDVLVAENGKEALDVLKREKGVSCVLMDIMMPEMDGYETMRHLRKDASFRNLPIIALTAKAMVGERERCIEAGATDYLSKPVDSDKLFLALGRWARAWEIANAV